MKKDDLIILLITLLLLAGMLVTIFFGGEKSRHGVGMLMDDRAGLQVSFSKGRKSKSETICPIWTYQITCLSFMKISQSTSTNSQQAGKSRPKNVFGDNFLIYKLVWLGREVYSLPELNQARC